MIKTYFARLSLDSKDFNGASRDSKTDILIHYSGASLGTLICGFRYLIQGSSQLPLSRSQIFVGSTEPVELVLTRHLPIFSVKSK